MDVFMHQDCTCSCVFVCVFRKLGGNQDSRGGEAEGEERKEPRECDGSEGDTEGRKDGEEKGKGRVKEGKRAVRE